MSNFPLEPQALIAHLSHRPPRVLKAMITKDRPPKRLTRTPFDRPSSVGTLDCLPSEIISIVLGMLDAQSIIRFATVSVLGDKLVDLQPAYRELIALVPHVLVALGDLGLLGLHPIADLHAALRSKQCTSCPEYGAFVFLPTCERCCWECLRHNPSFRLLLPREAKRYFGLAEWHLQRLPILRVIPGKYGILGISSSEKCRLVSLRAARELGLSVYGSMDRLAEAMARRCTSARLLAAGQFLQGRLSVPQGQDTLLLPIQRNMPMDLFFGMATIAFPALSTSGEVEEGLWCRGCELTYHLYDTLRLPGDVLASLVPPNSDPERVLLGLARRARSKATFLDHVRQCYGAQQMLSEMTANTS